MITRRRFLTLVGVGGATAAVGVRTLVGWQEQSASAAVSGPGRGLFGGLTTLDQTMIKDTPDGKGYMYLKEAAGEAHVLRTEGFPFAHPTLGLAAFAQMTDLHVVDDKSPARVEFTDRFADPWNGTPDPNGYGTASAYRPHEMLSTHIVEAMTQAIRDVGTGPVTGLPLAFTIVTGDMVDNVQYNEVRWYIDLLDGGHQIQADSGMIGLEESVSGHFIATPVAGLNHDGVYWSPDGVAFDTKDPDTGIIIDNYRNQYGFPVVRGLLPAARRPYDSTGLGMPWYAAMGNHDGEIQGNYPVHPSFLEHTVIPDISDHATAGRKPYGSAVALQPDPSDQNVADFINNLQYAGVFSDQRRHFLTQTEFAKEHFTTTGLPKGHGFSSDGTTYYAIPFTNTDLVRYITLDTVNYDGDANGRVKKAQYDWIESQLRANSSKYLSRDNVVINQPGITDKLFVIFCHHTLETINNDTGDVVTHDFFDGKLVERLLLSFPNVILVVNGHTHANDITYHCRNTRSPLGNLVSGWAGGFWEVNTAAHIDWPSQSRIVEIAAGANNGLAAMISIFTTMVDLKAPARYGNDLSTPAALASLARELAANDPTERLRPAAASRAGTPADRNVQLMTPAPFVLPLPPRWGSSVALARNSDGRLELFGTNRNDALFERFEHTAGTGTWDDWIELDGSLRAITATNGNGVGNVVTVVGTNSSGVVVHRSQQSVGGSAMTGWSSLGPVNARSLAMTRTIGGVEIFSVTSTGDVWRNKLPGTFATWVTGFGQPGTRFTQIAAAANALSRVEIFTLDVTGGLWRRGQTFNGDWTGWTTLPTPAGVPFIQLAVANNVGTFTTLGQLQLFLIDNDRRVWTAWQPTPTSETMTNFSLLDGSAPQSRMTQIAAHLNSNGLIQLVGVDHAGAIWHRHQTAQNSFTSWTAWVAFAGVLRPDVPTPPSG